jgi:AcrR family transcriptional regulator
MGIQERKKREKARRRQQILVAAKRVFADKGFGKATMEDIAKEAELSAGTLYLYFKNKNELNSSLGLRVLQFLLVRLDHLHNDATLDLRDKIHHLKTALYDVYEFDPLVLRNFFILQSSEVLNDLSPQLIEEIKGGAKKALQKIESIFHQGIQHGICIDLKAKKIANIVWSLFSGIVMWESTQEDMANHPSVVKPMLDTAFEIFENGIMIQGGASS